VTNPDPDQPRPEPRKPRRPRRRLPRSDPLPFDFYDKRQTALDFGLTSPPSSGSNGETQGDDDGRHATRH
jgi:hypothetical protein